MTHARFFPDLEKSSILHILPTEKWKFELYQYIWYQQKATGTGFHVDVTYFLSDLWKMHKRALSWYFNL